MMDQSDHESTDQEYLNNGTHENRRTIPIQGRGGGTEIY